VQKSAETNKYFMFPLIY